MDFIKRKRVIFMESEIKTNKIKIEKIDENDYNRIFVMSDIHGQYDLFLKMLDRIDLKREDLNSKQIRLIDLKHQHHRSGS